MTSSEIQKGDHLDGTLNRYPKGLVWPSHTRCRGGLTWPSHTRYRHTALTCFSDELLTCIWLSHLEVSSFTAQRSGDSFWFPLSSNFLCLTGTWFCLYWVSHGPLGVEDGRACVYIANHCRFVRDGKTGPRRGVVLSVRPALGVTGSFQYQQALKGWAVGQRAGTAAGTPHVSQDGRGTAGQQLWPFFVGAFFGVYYMGSTGWVKNPITSNISHGAFIAWKPRITIEVKRQARLRIFNGDSTWDGTRWWGNPQRAFVMRAEAAPSSPGTPSFWHADGTVLLAKAGQPPSALTHYLRLFLMSILPARDRDLFFFHRSPNATLALYSLVSRLLAW